MQTVFMLCVEEEIQSHETHSLVQFSLLSKRMNLINYHYFIVTV